MQIVIYEVLQKEKLVGRVIELVGLTNGSQDLANTDIGDSKHLRCSYVFFKVYYSLSATTFHSLQTTKESYNLQLSKLH